MCTLSKEKNHVGIKKISLNGDISANVDYGIGYTICWQNKPYSAISAKDQRVGAYIQDIICRCIDQADFMNKFTQEKKFEQVKTKLFEALSILQNSNEQV